MHKNPPCAFKKFLEINGGRQVWFGLARALPELAPAGSGPDCCTTEVPRASNRQSGPQTQPTPTRNCLPQLWAPFRAQEVPNSWAASPPHLPIPQPLSPNQTKASSYTHAPLDLIFQIFIRVFLAGNILTMNWGVQVSGGSWETRYVCLTNRHTS